mgnify:CR=1 FL=1
MLRVRVKIITNVAKSKGVFLHFSSFPLSLEGLPFLTSLLFPLSLEGRGLRVRVKRVKRF